MPAASPAAAESQGLVLRVGMGTSSSWPGITGNGQAPARPSVRSRTASRTRVISTTVITRHQVVGHTSRLPVFTWCQVPFVYRLDDSAEPAVTLTLDDGSQVSPTGLTLPTELSAELFQRTGRIRQVEVRLVQIPIIAQDRHGKPISDLLGGSS